MRLRKRGFYHYESWRLESYLALWHWRTTAMAGICLEASTRPRKNIASASALTPRQVPPVTRGGTGSQNMTTNWWNPAQAQFLTLLPNPRKKQNNFWPCGYVQWLPVETVGCPSNFHRCVEVDVCDPAPASKVRVKSSSWEGVELTASVFSYECVCSDSPVNFIF